MPETPYRIFPSESFLLGVCLGEYAESKDSFLEVIDRRLAPFYPEVVVDSPSTEPAVSDTKIADLAARLAWTDPTWMGEEFAYSDEFPNILFVRHNGSIVQQHIPRLSRNFVGAVTSVLADGLIWSPFDCLRFAREGNRAKAIVEIFELWTATQSGSPTPKAIQSESTGDEKRVVTERLDEWVRKWGSHDFFSQGRVFGQLIHAIRSITQFVIESGDAGLDKGEFFNFARPLFQQAHRFADQTVRLSLVCYNHHAEFAVKNVIEHVGRYVRFERRVSADSSLRAYAESPAKAWERLAEPPMTLICIAMGAIFGSLRDDDAEARVQDASAAIPRYLSGGASVAQIRQQLVAAEMSLATNPSQSDFPEMTIRTMSFAIERLAKLLWPSDVPPKGASSFRELFDWIIRGRNRLDVRFASIAKSLYLEYRNPATHEEFRCSLVEAKHFLAGVHALLDLHDQIIEGRNRNRRGGTTNVSRE